MPTLRIPLKPVPASRPRVSKWSTYYGKTYETYKKTLPLYIPKNKVLIDGAIECNVMFAFKAKRKHDIGKYATISFDIDNLEKALYDACNGRLWLDDCQIVKHFVQKIYDTEAYILLSYQEVKNNGNHVNFILDRS